MTGDEKIEVEYDLPESPSKVWRALTEPALLKTWLMENDIAPELGHQFTFRSKPMGNWNGIVDCQVLEVIPEARLVYTWKGRSASQDSGDYVLDTIVSWTLEAQSNGGTLLRLVHDGFRPGDFALHALGSGWKGKGAEISRASAASS